MTFLIPMLVPLLVLGGLSTVLIQQYVTHEINSNNINVLKQTKENIELILNEQDSLNLHIVASAVQFVQLQNMLNKTYPTLTDFEQLAMLKNFIDSPAIGKPYIDSIYIYVKNEMNRFISSTTGGMIELPRFYDRAWYESYTRQSQEVTDWTEERKSKKLGVGNAILDNRVISMYKRISVSEKNTALSY